MFPTIILSSIPDALLDDLMHIGFCYVKLPNKTLIAQIKTCIVVARNFFQCNMEEKEKWKLKKNLKLGDRYQGYALRSQSKNTNAIEQIFFEPDSPFGPYEPYSHFIKGINEVYINVVFSPLINAIFKRLDFSYANFIETTKDPYCSLVFQSCPSIGEHKNTIRLNTHKDFGLLTILFFEEPGLEVKYQNDWKAIPPKEGCVVVNLGNAIELMTGKRCHSALHRVINATENRTSMVYFINPNYKNPVRNYVDDTIISATGELFFKQQFAEYYETDY